MYRKTTKELEAKWEASQLKKDGVTKEAYIRLSREAATIYGESNLYGRCFYSWLGACLLQSIPKKLR